MRENGVYFQNGLKKPIRLEGEIYEGYQYANANDNQFIPLLKFEESQLIIVNK
jgi:hypothetical protein